MGYAVTVRPAAPALVAPLLWEVVKADPELPAGTTFALFRLHCTVGYRFLGVYAGAELIGAVGFHGNLLHLAIVPAWRGKWYSERLGRQIVAYGLQRVPALLAIIRQEDRATVRLARSLGFVRIAAGKWEQWQLPAPVPAPSPGGVGG